MAERVLLTDLAEVSESFGVTWHRVRTPSGIEGWASGRYLEGEVPEASPDPREEGLPRLQVVDVEHCLNVRAKPYIEADIVDCIPLGTSVADSHWIIEGPGGVIWRGLGWPFLGFASDRYLEGPEPSYIKPLPPHVAPEEFPNVAVLGTPIRHQWLPRPTDPRTIKPTRLDRIYRRSDGEVVREPLVTVDDLAAAHPDAFSEIGEWEEIIYFAVTPDGSHAHLGICNEVTFYGNHCVGTLRLFRSTDGGVTWSYLGSVNADDVTGGYNVRIVGVLSGEDPQLVVANIARQVMGSSRFEVRQFPSGETRIIDVDTDRWGGIVQLLGDGRIAIEKLRHPSSETDRREYFWLAEDGEDLGSELPDHLQLVLPDTSPIPSGLLQHYLPGDDPPEDWPTDRYRYLFYNLESVPPSVIVQQGPFLRVAGVADCLPIRAEPSSSSGEIACTAERVLLTDLDEKAELEGATWHSIRTPAGVEGWADGRYLE